MCRHWRWTSRRCYAASWRSLKPTPCNWTKRASSCYPQDAQWAADAINYVLDGILNEKAVHLCFGNYGGQPMLRGFWRDMVPFLNRLRTDHLVLEFARRGYDELEVLNDLDRRIELGIGVVDIKDNEVESPELIASRTDRIVKTVGPNR